MGNIIMPSREDVLDVAKFLRKELTEEMIQQVLDIYPYEQELDLGATWDLVVEHCIYSIS